MLAQSLFLLALMISPVFSATHTVSVANNKSLTFEPSEVKAELGDIIEFKFLAGNHTVTQSTFASPCTNAGFNSGQIPGNADSPTSYSILVNDTKPIWVYCATGQHCQNGMVMAVNAPTSGNTFSAFQANAMGGENATTAGNSTGSASTSGSASSSTAAISGADGSAGVTVSNTTAAADSSASASASSTNGTSSSSSSDSSASSLDINFLPISMIALLALWFTSV
ncbi:hypothetical protein L486_03496 [Kwoniella mangroviensis CBS 10435]|uniref:Phytocyanin domain-containing protein n=1 Tax=Kwoniella mangroviensis CBS 10435 TaxID=1331196 RepID=A0A1B9ITX9_9TREE|nr:uncharacterized protein I203_02184 [Kwoniella mangroviensis CBS 8507]OCF58998.1 hypothetical protein L486_03496 [Kwoniella mangroviensis CBS 10435]OCF68793.1 hypothetical protein I203_02184 [Kwoniella mangroviensis CBS 8507]